MGAVAQRDSDGYFLFDKQEEEMLDFSVDMTRSLDSVAAEAIDLFVVEVENSDASFIVGDGVDTVDTGVDDDVVVPALEFDDTSLLAWIGGGTPGTDYRVKYHYRTDAGRHGTVKLKIRVR